GSGIENGGGRFFLASLCQTQQGTQVMDDLFKAADGKPALGLLVDSVPRRQIVGQVAPSRSGTHEPAERDEDLPQRVVPLGSVLNPSPVLHTEFASPVSAIWKGCIGKRSFKNQVGRLSALVGLFGVAGASLSGCGGSGAPIIDPNGTRSACLANQSRNDGRA